MKSRVKSRPGVDSVQLLMGKPNEFFHQQSGAAFPCQPMIDDEQSEPRAAQEQRYVSWSC
jgi:hypothetical protein